MTGKPTVSLSKAKDTKKFRQFSEGLDPVLISGMFDPKINIDGLIATDYQKAMQAVTIMMDFAGNVDAKFIEDRVNDALPAGDSREAIKARMLEFLAEVVTPDAPKVSPKSQGTREHG